MSKSQATHKNTFVRCVDCQAMLKRAEALVALRDTGIVYIHLNISDCYSYARLHKTVGPTNQRSISVYPATQYSTQTTPDNPHTPRFLSATGVPPPHSTRPVITPSLPPVEMSPELPIRFTIGDGHA